MSNLHQSNILLKTSQDYSKLIGIPYETLDCWGIVREFYKIVFNIELRAYYEIVPKTREEAKEIVYNSMADFVEVKDREFGDIFLIKMFGVESHIAVYLGNGTMLHTSKHSGCLIEKVTRWEKLIVGTYRARK
jgi:cell wall-associated NlpC family hydrolase